MAKRYVKMFLSACTMGSAKVTVTLVEAQQIFSQARAWYKGQRKSSNKRYEPLFQALSPAEKVIGGLMAATAPVSQGSPSNPLLSRVLYQDKVDRRNSNADSPAIRHMRRMFFRSGTNFENRGAWLQRHDIRYGNCGEMACLAAHLVRQSHPSAKIFMVSLGDTGDHAFITVNLPPQGTQLCNISGRGSIVIDVWMNICCEAYNYHRLALAKLKKWTSEGKRIAFGTNSFVIPDSPQYIQSLFYSSLTITDMNRNPVTAEGISVTAHGQPF